MSILGSLIIELKASTASFVEGMSGAGKTAKTVGRDIEDAFSGLGNVINKALAPFGEIGAVAGETFGRLGETVGAVTGSFAHFGLTAEGVKAAALASGAALLATDAGVVGIAIHAAMAAAELGELSQRTGVSTRTLAALEIGAKETGVSTEGLGKALQFMNANAVKAAIAPESTMTAFKRLGVEVRDSSGHVRDSGALFLDIASKISNLPQPEQGFFTKAIFGRGGAEVIPLINLGRDRLEELVDMATKLNLGDPQTIAASLKFKETVADIGTEFQAIGLQLAKDMLPALQFLAEKIKIAFENGSASKFIDVLANIVKGTIAVADTFYAMFQQWKVGGELFQSIASRMFEGLKILKEGADSPWKIFDSSFRAQAASVFSGLKSDTQKFSDDSKAIWKDNENFIKGVFAPGKPLPLPKVKTGSADLDSAGRDNKRDIIAETIGKLRGQTAEEAALATAISDVAANTIIATAAAEAEKNIIQTNAKAKRENRSLTEAEKKEIRDLTLLQDAYKEGAKDNKGLEDFIQKTQLQTKSLQALGAAYSANLPVAIEQAREAEKTAPFAKQITDIQGVITALRNMGASSAVLAPLETSLAQLQDKFARAKVAVHELFVAEDTDKWAKAIGDLRAQKDQMDAFIPVAVQGTAALREFNIQQASEKFARENPALSQAQINEYRNSLRALETDKIAMAAADKVAASQSFLATRLQLDDLELLRQKEIQVGQDTAATDVLIYQTKTRALIQYMDYFFQAQNAQLIGNAAIFDAQIRLVKQWDELQFKVGTFGNRVKAVFNELAIQGKLAGAQIAQAFLTAFDSAEGQLAHLIVTGKANFLNVLQTLEESIVKAGIQKAVGGILGGIGLHLPGFGPQLGSTPTSPMYVFAVNELLSNSPIGTSASPDVQGGGIGGPNITGVGGLGTIGLPVGVFQQSLNTMSAAQTVFAGRFGASWTGILGIFRGAIGLMTSLFHIHTASVIAGHAAQTGAAVTSQAAQTAAASTGAAARGNIGLIEHLKAIFRHAAGAAAAVFHKVFEALPFPVNLIVAPVAAAGAFAGVLAWGALGSAARGALVPEDMLMLTHKNEMVIPSEISTGLQNIIRSNQGGNVPSVHSFSGSTSSNGTTNPIHVHVHQGDIHAVDQDGVRNVMRKGSVEMGKQIRRMFQTGYLNPRRLARV